MCNNTVDPQQAIARELETGRIGVIRPEYSIEFMPSKFVS